MIVEVQLMGSRFISARPATDAAPGGNRPWSVADRIAPFRVVPGVVVVDAAEDYQVEVDGVTCWASELGAIIGDVSV